MKTGSRYNQLVEYLKGLNYDKYIWKLNELVKDPKLRFLLNESFGGYLSDDKLKFSVIDISVRKLVPCQNEIDITKSLKYGLTKPESLASYFKNPVVIKTPIITYNGNFIIDGHHRWSQIYCFNIDAKMTAWNYEGDFSALQMLKIMQAAIASDLGEVPTHKVEGMNLLNADIGDIKNYIREVADPKFYEEYAKCAKCDDDPEEVINIIASNCESMQSDNDCIKDAPNRGFMPQTDEAPSVLEDIKEGVVIMSKRSFSPYKFDPEACIKNSSKFNLYNKLDKNEKNQLKEFLTKFNYTITNEPLDFDKISFMDFNDRWLIYYGEINEINEYSTDKSDISEEVLRKMDLLKDTKEGVVVMSDHDKSEDDEKYREAYERYKNYDYSKRTFSHKWSDFRKFAEILDKYLPDEGEGDTVATQISTAVSKLIYKWFNDGDVYDNTYYLKGWANNLSSWANWLCNYLDPKVKRILEGIKNVKSKDGYTNLLYDLNEYIVKIIDNYSSDPKIGSVYECRGPFKFIDDGDDLDSDMFSKDEEINHSYKELSPKSRGISQVRPVTTPAGRSFSSTKWVVSVYEDGTKDIKEHKEGDQVVLDNVESFQVFDDKDDAENFLNSKTKGFSKDQIINDLKELAKVDMTKFDDEKVYDQFAKEMRQSYGDKVVDLIESIILEEATLYDSEINKIVQNCGCDEKTIENCLFSYKDFLDSYGMFGRKMSR